MLWYNFIEIHTHILKLYSKVYRMIASDPFSLKIRFITTKNSKNLPFAVWNFLVQFHRFHALFIMLLFEWMLYLALSSQLNPQNFILYSMIYERNQLTSFRSDIHSLSLLWISSSDIGWKVDSKELNKTSSEWVLMLALIWSIYLLTSLKFFKDLSRSGQHMLTWLWLPNKKKKKNEMVWM